jgi:molybdate transport system ATP-binding protein
VDALPLVQITGAAVLHNGQRIFPRTSWSILPGEHWAVIGPNGSGKTTLARALWDAVPVVDGAISWPAAGPGAVGHATFDDSARRIARYSLYLQGRYESLEDGSAPTARHELDSACAKAARAALRPGAPTRARVLRVLGLRRVLDREVSRLSNGETRKLLLAEAILARPRLLVLEEPLQGLDARSRRRLSRLLAGQARLGMTFVFVCCREADVPRFVRHILRVKDAAVAAREIRGPAFAAARRAIVPEPAAAPGTAGPASRPVPRRKTGPVIVDLRKVTVRLGTVTILDRVSWRIREGESWALVGPNGSGKTTLLSLILADHPQAYANDVRVFGRRRGDGQGIWEIKAQVGHVSPEAQALEPGDLTVREAVLPGLEVGPGVPARSAAARDAALGWIARLGLAGSEQRTVGSLSDGEKRLVLLARSLAASPRLLVLDEPCQGLDEEHRRTVLSAVDALGRQETMSLVYVTHEPAEIPACVTRVLALRAGRAARRPLFRPGRRR